MPPARTTIGNIEMGGINVEIHVTAERFNSI
jgi:hypothetical protein